MASPPLRCAGQLVLGHLGKGDMSMVVLGIDAHKRTHTVVAVDEAGRQLAFSRDGKTLAAGRADHTVRLWDIAYLVNVVPRLCASAGRSLTRAEWARYVPVLAYQKVCP